MEKFKRIFLIVIDSLGIGYSPDAIEYNDLGADTLGHIDACKNPFYIENLMKLGLEKLHSLQHVKTQKAIGYQARLLEASVGKDTLTGHLEMMGLLSQEAPLTFTETGFPKDLIQELEKKTGHTFIGNIASSGTTILEQLGHEETESKGQKLILYTSADSVLQICGNEQIIGLEELYRCCQIAREITFKPEWKVARVIARPYIFRDGKYIRTCHRKDYSLDPPMPTCLDILKDHGFDVLAIGKIYDIFNGHGITRSYHSNSSIHGMDQTIEQTRNNFTGLCFTNLVDFDAKWGHRRDPIGYGKELEAFDKKLKILIEHLNSDDLLMITADHGNDPTFHGTDHTREMVPLLMFSSRFTESKKLDDQESFGCIAQTILENFNLPTKEYLLGKSLLAQLK